MCRLFFLAPCSLANASGPKARFWGGKARRGLRKNLDQIRSLKNGDPEISLKRYDVASSDYPWFDYPSRQGRWNIGVALPYALWEQLLRALKGSTKRITDLYYPDSLAARKKQIWDQKLVNVKRKLNLLPTGLETRTRLRYWIACDEQC